MPKKLVWTPRMDAELERRRAGGAGFETIGRALGVTANAALERARRLKIRLRPTARPVQPDDLLRPPLPAGHMVSWGVLVAGTLLEGEPFVGLGPMGRERGPVIGD